MKATQVIMVRIYITESSHLLNKIIHYLKNEAKIHGVSVFRAISGFGESGTQHTASLMELSLDLPLTIEFFDNPQKIETAIEYLSTLVKPEHIVSWDVKANI